MVKIEDLIIVRIPPLQLQTNNLKIRKIVYFRWLLVHNAIPVNGWRKGNIHKMCPFCIDLIETSEHCLWSCDFAMDIW